MFALVPFASLVGWPFGCLVPCLASKAGDDGGRVARLTLYDFNAV